MKITVVIPTFNRATLLKSTLDAVFGQFRLPDEVIVVDDGSQDNTAEMLQQTFGNRVIYIRIENSGDLVARNTGTRAATGDVVAYCDSDDLWRRDFLSRVDRLWRIEPAIQTAYCNFVIVDGDVWQDKRKFDDAPKDFWEGLRCIDSDLGVFDEPVVGRLINFQPFFTSCMVVDRALFLEIGGWDEAVSRVVGCDFATALRVAEHPPIGIIRAPLVGIRRHPGNFSRDVQAMNLGDSLVLEHVLATRPSLAKYSESLHNSINDRRVAALDLAFARRDFQGVREIFELLDMDWRTWPVKLKARVAALSYPVNVAMAVPLLAMGSIRAYMPSFAVRWR